MFFTPPSPPNMEVVHWPVAKTVRAFDLGFFQEAPRCKFLGVQVARCAAVTSTLVTFSTRSSLGFCLLQSI